MNWQYAVFAGLAGLLSLSLAFLAWSHRRARGAVYFVLLMIAVSVWSLSNAVESMPWNAQTKILWSQISYIGVVSVGPLWLLLALSYSHHLRHWAGWHILLLWIVPLAVMVLVATNQHHGLIWTQVTPVSDAPGTSLIYGRGIGFWINVVYIYVSMLAGTILLIRTTLRSTQLYRRQIWALLLGALLPWVGNLWYLLRLPPLPESEKAPIGFALSGLMLTYGLFRLRLFDIVPIARDTLIENMPDGVLVLDEYDRLVDINPAACRLLDQEAAQIVGQPIAVVLARWSDLADRYRDHHQVQTEITINSDRWFDLNISALYNRQQQLSGRLVVLRDITARKQAEKALQDSERQYRELYTTAQRQMHELSLLNQVRTTLARELDLPTIFHDVVEAIAKTFGYTLVSLYLQQDDELVLQHQVGYTRVFERIPITQGVSGRVARTGEPILLQNVNTDPAFLEAVPNITSEVCVPLIDQGQVVGILNVESNDPTALTEADLALLVALGEHITIAIERARLYGQVRERERYLEELVQARTAALRREIAEREQVQEALRESESRFRAIYNTANVLIIAHDTEGKVIYINPYACQTLGYQAEELLGQRIRPLFEESEIQKARPLTARLTTDPNFQVEGFEQYLLKKDGQHVLINWNVTALRDGEGNVTGILGVGQDITIRKQMEEELERHRAHLEELVAARTTELHENQVLLEQTVWALRDREHFLDKLNDITQAALETSDLTAMLQILADRMGDLFQADGCYLTLWDETRQQTIAGAAYGAWRDRYRAVQIAPDEATVAASVLRTGHTLAIEDVHHTPYLSSRIAELFPDRSLLGLPLIAAEQKLGAALIAYNKTHVFTPLEIARGEQVARQIALAVTRARLYQELQAYAGQLEERVRARTAELQAQYAQLDAILRSVDDVIFMTDPEQRILYVNPAFTVQTGYTSTDVLGQTVCSLGILGNLESLAPSILPTLMQGKVWHGEALGQRKDGRTYDAALTITPVHDEARLITGYVFTHRDISQAKNLERARNQFITNVSHQFLTPLTPLKTGIYLLKRTVQSEKQRQQLEAMETGINLLIQLVKDTLEISVLDSGKGTGIRVPVSIPDIAEEVLERYQNQAQTAGLTLMTTPVPTDLPSVEGDAGRLAQALGELVENAIVFTPAGGEVSVAVQADVIEGENWITIAVHDTGPGITPEELPRLFERFFRGSLAESGYTAGTGLGLSIAQKIAEAHGGHITVESAIGQGSTFTLWLRPVLRKGENRSRTQRQQR